ncbi:sensor histidine kinase [Streptomyces sp. NPDC086989]|uniref:sensor histidine kinase n=1 Tax=Streptomyces sp. NPDC086989 TaxID=3365764 RepID=UPI00380DEE7E
MPGPGPGPVIVRRLVPAAVPGDRALLGHRVRNLLVNAVRHDRPGGRIAVAPSADGVLTVSHPGPVIDPADVPRLLEPFRRRAGRRHTAGEGAGPGLSIVAPIARAHGAKPVVRADRGPGRRADGPGAPSGETRAAPDGVVSGILMTACVPSEA